MVPPNPKLTKKLKTINYILKSYIQVVISNSILKTTKKTKIEIINKNQSIELLCQIWEN